MTFWRPVTCFWAIFTVSSALPRLFGPSGELPLPSWPHAELLSEDPPIFLLRNFLSSFEAERLLRDYDVELIPEFVRHANASGDPYVMQRCMERFPASFCNSTPEAGDRCDFQCDQRVFASQVMGKVHERISSTVQLPEDHIEEAWLFNWDRTRRGQALHLDNFHHFQFPKRVATVIVRLRDDPVGIGFPLATWPGMHELAQDDELVAKLNEEGNTLPWRGNGQGRSFKSHGYLDEAFQEVCRDAPLKLRQGDGLLYYHLRQNGEVNLRSMHGSCSTEDASEPKIFMAKFVRGGSLLSTFGSLRTPELLAELRAWMDTRQRESGLDAAAIWMSGTEHGLLEPTGCQKQPRTLGSPWFVRPEADAKNPTMLCAPPSQFQRRRAGEVFEIHIMIGNTGAQPWPSNTVLSLRDGDPMGGPAGLRLPEVPVGSTVPLSWQLTAPESGKVFSVWSLADGDRAPFGPLLWVDAVIEEQDRPDTNHLSDCGRFLGFRCGRP